MQQLVKQIIKDEIDPLFKENGFKKKRNNFAKIFSEFAWTVNIQFSKWNTKEEVRFTFNTGIFINKLFSTYSDEVPPKFPNDNVSTFRCRIGDLNNITGDSWYTLNQDTSVEELIKQIRGDIQVIFSHFELFHTIEDIIFEMERKEKDMRVHFSTLDLIILYYHFGNIEKAKKRITEIYSNNDIWWDFKLNTKRIAGRLGIYIMKD